MPIAGMFTRKRRHLSRIRIKKRRTIQDEQSQDSGLHSTTSELHKIIIDSPSPSIGTTKDDSIRYPGNLMRQGSIGEGVRTVQIMLNRNGENLETDGIFGPLTLKAVVQFQRSNNLLVDGIIGAQTWGALAEGDKTKDDEPDDFSGYTSELQELYGRLLDEITSPEEFNQIIDQIFTGFPAPPQSSSKNTFAPYDATQPLSTLLARVDYYMALYASSLTIGGITCPVLGIKELNLLLRSLQEGKANSKLPVEYLPLLPLVLPFNDKRKSLISLVIFLNGAEGYRRLVTGMIKLKQQNIEPPEDLAKRMSFVHRAVSNIGAIESHADSGEKAGATIGKVGYTKDNLDKPKTKTLYPLRRGAELFDRMWMEAVKETFYSGNDRWGSVGQHSDHIQILKPPNLPSWCGIYVTWIALQENLISNKWAVGGGNVEYKHWDNQYDITPTRISKLGIAPGDILYAMNNYEHECIAISYNPETGMVTSIDGNTGPAGSATGGQILVQERHYSFFSHVRPFKGNPKPGQMK